MQYFKHMTNMRHDLKIRRLISKYGLEGYGLYNLILESITESVTTENPIPELKESSNDLAEFYNVDTYKAEEIVNFCISQELFETDEITGRVLCKKLYKFFDQSQTRSNEIRKLISEYKAYSDKIDNVYVMKNENMYKIGKSLYPEKRLSEINNKIPGKTILILVKETDYGYKLENELHRLFKDKKIKDEWFNLSNDDIEKLKNDYGFSVYRQALTDMKEQEQEQEQEKNKKRRRKELCSDNPPNLNDIIEYIRDKKINNVDPNYFYEYFTSGNWIDSKGNNVYNWKQKILTWSKHNTDNKPAINQPKQTPEMPKIY